MGALCGENFIILTSIAFDWHVWLFDIHPCDGRTDTRAIAHSAALKRVYKTLHRQSCVMHDNTSG